MSCTSRPICAAGVFSPPTHSPLVEAIPLGFEAVGTHATTSLTVVVTSGRPMTLSEIVNKIVAMIKFINGPPNMTASFFGTLKR